MDNSDNLYTLCTGSRTFVKAQGTKRSEAKNDSCGSEALLPVADELSEAPVQVEKPVTNALGVTVPQRVATAKVPSPNDVKVGNVDNSLKTEKVDKKR